MLRHLAFVFICLSACSQINSNVAEIEPCKAPIGWQDMAKIAEGNFLIFGEMHGTKEVPTAFGNYVCAVSQQGGKTLIGLEMSQSYQATIDEAKLIDNPRSFLLSEMKDHWSIEDGRSSEAMLDLVVRLLSYENVSVHAFEAPIRTPSEQATYDQTKSDTSSGQRHQARSERMRDSLINRYKGFDRAIVLTGNIHGSEASFGFLEGAENLAMLLPGNPITLNNRFDGGHAWNMRHDHKSGPNPLPKNLRGVPDGIAAPSMGLSEALTPSFDGFLYVGKATASPPAGKK